MLAVTRDGKGFTVGLTNGEIRQLSLDEYAIRSIERTAGGLLLGLDDGLTEAGVRAIGVMPATVDPSVSIIDKMPGADDLVDYFGSVRGRAGSYYVSKNGASYDILGPRKPEKLDFCAPADDDSEFFHIFHGKEGSVIAIGARGLCIVGKDRQSGQRMALEDQRIEDVAISVSRQLALVNGWHLQVIDLARGLPGPFLRDKKGGFSVSEGMTTLEKAGLFLAISNEELVAIDMATSDMKPLGADSINDTQAPTAPLRKIAELARQCLKTEAKPVRVVGNDNLDVAAITVAAEDGDAAIFLLNLDQGFCRAVVPSFKGNPYNQPVTFSRDGARIAILEADALLVFDTSTGEQISRFDAPSFQDLRRIAFDPTGARILAWRDRNIAQPDAEIASLWRLPEGQRIDIMMPGRIRNASFAAGGDVVIVLDDDGRSSAFSADTGKKIVNYRTTKYITEFLAEAEREGVAGIGDSVSEELMLVDIKTGVSLDSFKTDGFGTIVGANSTWPTNILFDNDGAGFFVASRKGVAYFPVPIGATAVLAAADRSREKFGVQPIQ